MSPVPQEPALRPETETFNPWSIVNLVFHHLTDHGLHPVLGEAGDPGQPAADLLRALGIHPALEGNRQVSDDVREQLAALRSAFAASDDPAAATTTPRTTASR